MNTGVRSGESGGMKWKHYGYEDANVKVRNNYGKITYYDDNFEKVKSLFYKYSILYKNEITNLKCTNAA